MHLGFVASLPVRAASNVARSVLHTPRSPRHLRQCTLVCASLPATTPPVHEYPTQPIQGQRAGTSGLRRKASVVTGNPNFVCNYVQSLFYALGGSNKLEGSTLVLGGDGRFGNTAAIQAILRLAAGNGFKSVIVGRHGLLSTPAAALLAPRAGALGAIILTASHNPGGPDGDWGIKYNTSTGAAAPVRLTDAVYEETMRIRQYRMADFGGDLPLDEICTLQIGSFQVQVIDPVTEYVRVMKDCFDFNAISKLVTRSDFNLRFDAMNAVTGAYASQVFVNELGALPDSLIRCEPKSDFGGVHPDPNLTYAAGLVQSMKQLDSAAFGAASDGDGDRNMILGGAGAFVTPADSVAIIADHADIIPYFVRFGLKGVARSMPTASALDRVAEARDVPCYETPTGWKHFATLLDGGLLSLCGEESFGTGSAHCKEKDGLWAVLAWLTILAKRNQGAKVGELVGVGTVLDEHWQRYGRTYALRHDYEALDAEAGAEVMAHLRAQIDTPQKWAEGVLRMDEFSYTDPVDGSISERQGVRVYTTSGERFVVRLSGTGSAGATVRVYFEGYDEPKAGLGDVLPSERLQSVVRLANSVSGIERLTGRSEPTVET